MRLFSAAILTLAVSCSAIGQTYTIQTFAGGGLPVNIPGTSAGLNDPRSAAVDKAGNVFFADGNTVLRLDATTGVLTLMAGNGTPGFSGDNGPATSAQLAGAEGVAVDAAGNLYIAEESNSRIRKVSNGVITTVAGNGTPGFSGDNGPATSAQLNDPQSVAVDAAGNLYIADGGNARIRKVSNGIITTVAGNGDGEYSGDNGPATSAQVSPTGVAVDAAGNLYIADAGNDRIRKVSNGIITTVAGNGISGYGGDNGPATSAQLDHPEGVAVDAVGNLYIADSSNLRIRKVSNGIITTVAGNGDDYDSGNGDYEYSGDNGPATSAQLHHPEGVVVDAAGNLYIADSWNGRIRKVSNGVITTVAGNGIYGYGGDNGSAASAQLNDPQGVAVDAAGNLYIADTYNNRIRKVSNGVIVTVAGTGTQGYSGDNGPAISAELGFPYGVAVDAAGNLYIADFGNNRIRKVSNGVITTVAGNGTYGYSGDNGPATSAQLNYPEGVAVDAAGNLYIADTSNNRIRKVSKGVITTVAGGGSVLLGDNGPATSAQLYNPIGVAVDSAGNLYIADPNEGRLRKVSNGVITTVAGGGSVLGDNGPATSAQVSPAGVAVDSAGNLYIADSLNNRIRKVSNGIITTVAGTGTSGYGGDNGPATDAQLSDPQGVGVDAAGNVYVADSDSNRIRVLTPSGPSCSASVTPLVLFPAASGGSFSVNISTGSPCGWVIVNQPDWIALSGDAGRGPGNLTLTVAANSGASRTASVSIAGVSVTINQAAPPLIGGVSNAASGLAAIAPNAFVSIYGSDFTPAGFSDDWSKSIVNGNLPTTLDGVSVSVGGVPAYVSFVSPWQINILTPNVASGNTSITVTAATTTTIPVTVVSQQFSPAFFPWPNGQPVATHLDYSWAVKNGSFGATTVPAKPGEYIILWGTGFGPTTPTAPFGVTIPSGTTYYTANPVSVTIGSVNAPVYGTALASGFGGLYQVVALVPATLTNGDYALVATVGGVASATTMLTVHN
jgi:uncharacterized protein (TIGR03437 family)